MEGLEDADLASKRRQRSAYLEPEQRDWRMISRWAVFFCGVAIVAISVVVLGVGVGAIDRPSRAMLGVFLFGPPRRPSRAEPRKSEPFV
jgi:uncharacterized protein (DUF2236 family)